MRINQYLARCGIGSRRNVEHLILNHRVSVNGEIVEALSFKVQEGDLVMVDSKVVRPLESVYIVMNKPRGVVCAVRDPRCRTVLDILPFRIRQLAPFPVGRLDKDSQGLLILTNDGDFCDSLLHPSRGIIKTYEVDLDGEVRSDLLDRMRCGIWSEGEFLKPVSVDRIGRDKIRVELQEGKKREIRRMVASLGLRVRCLLRRKIGRMELRHLPYGGFALFSKDDMWHHITVGGMV
ncbi:pseudouridine synthase family protein [Thermanaerovibrio velox DSM 12556]|uniref:Pseudouridine synthase n=1 Tax=Thermanaerovibrio velox DSM 12556 TaxID=926567 RepID=H0US53_9BACT|nr:pseudouridine synthase [Thermanaerovibrio velox]EHM10142.1 pseudouridine synthase family protein [Thermanaerovibrio velox DSM 12556]